MKSRITIEVDFSNANEPIIQILSRNSDDVRDNLIKSFYQKLGGSSWCKIVFKDDHWEDNNPNDERSFKRIFITPIPESELKEEAAIMREQFRVWNKYAHSNAEFKGDYRPSNRLDLMSAAEVAITDAISEVEKIGADERLTKASILLDDARKFVYDYLKSNKIS